MRPMPPAARCSSFQTSASAPTEPPPISAYSTNWPRPEHSHDGAEHQQDGAGGDQRLRTDAAARGLDRVAKRVVEAAAFVWLTGMGLHRTHRTEGLAGQAVGIGDAVLAVARDGAQLARADDDRQHRQRDAEQRPCGQPRAGDEQHRQAADHGHAAAQGDRHRRTDHAAQQFGVGGQPRDQLTAAAAIVEAGAQLDQVRVQLAAQVGDDLFAQQRHEVEARGGAQRHHHRHQHQQGEGTVDLAAAAEAVVDHLLHGRWQAQRGCRGHSQGEQPGREQATVAAHERP
ncbi:hypothetical protein G6F35_013376 [Rhizopus arrhizus]|nr:hypothetical protein G6F35_013376 [Rhizopus arrhizus]